MNKMKMLSSALLLSAVVLISSCKKDDESPSTKAVLIAKKWTITKVEMKIDGQSADMTMFFLEDCDKDDYTTFKEDGTYESNVGADDCNGDAETFSGTWTLSNGDKTLTLKETGYPDEVWNLTSVGSTKIVAESEQVTEDIDGDGDEETGSMVFTLTGK